MNITKNQRGFTIIEIIIAIIVLTVGLLGLVTTGALVTRMIARGQRSASASAFASRRLERERNKACIDAQRNSGQDTLYRGGVQPVDVYGCRQQELPAQDRDDV